MSTVSLLPPSPFPEPRRLIASPWSAEHLRDLLVAPLAVTPPVLVDLTVFTDEGLRVALVLPPLHLTLSGDPGGRTTYRLPLMPVPLLNTSTPVALVPAARATSPLLYLLYEVNPACPEAGSVPETRPGDPVPLAPAVSWKTFFWDAADPKFPTALMRALARGTVVCVKRSGTR